MAPGFPIPCQRPDPCGSKGREHYLLSKTLFSGNSMNFHSTYLLDCYLSGGKHYSFEQLGPEHSCKSSHCTLHYFSLFVGPEHSCKSSHSTLHCYFRFFVVWGRTSACKGTPGRRYQAIFDLTHPTHGTDHTTGHEIQWSWVQVALWPPTGFVPGVVPGSTLQSNSNMNELLIH